VPIEPTLFRSVLGRFATGVTIMTAASTEGLRAGVTASSFNTLSLDPPLVLWSLALTAPSLTVFRAAARFVVNILAEDQVAIAMQFARPSDDKFRGVDTRLGLGGVPLICGAIAHLECVVERRVPGGDHELYIGEIVRVEADERQPLIFSKGKFGQFADFA
jgi:flavin reductase (DIM6/NTAB) family NADH-FMN oxidoreductase RutF